MDAITIFALAYMGAILSAPVMAAVKAARGMLPSNERLSGDW